MAVTLESSNMDKLSIGATISIGWLSLALGFPPRATSGCGLMLTVSHPGRDTQPPMCSNNGFPSLALYVDVSEVWVEEGEEWLGLPLLCRLSALLALLPWVDSSAE